MIFKQLLRAEECNRVVLTSVVQLEYNEDRNSYSKVSSLYFVLISFRGPMAVGFCHE